MHSIPGNNSLNAWRAAVEYLLSITGKKTTNLFVAIEDGGRARVIEEGIAAYVYERADTHGYYANVEAVDFDLLKTIKDMTSRFEVGRRTFGDWEKAILEGYRLFRLLRGHHGGVVVANLITRTLHFSSSRTDGNGL